MSPPLRLGVNVDHVATLRNARGGVHPDPLAAAEAALHAGAESITVHLREDRRHIRDADVSAMRLALRAPINLEMALTPAMVAFAGRIRPHACCLVPERREELTTEGGLDVAGQEDAMRALLTELRGAGARVSLFLDPEARQIETAARLGVGAVELHTGTLCEAHAAGGREAELARLSEAARLVESLGMECHAGHGLDYETAALVAAIPQVVELNIGHFLVGEAVLVGLPVAVRRMREVMTAARKG